MGQIIELKGPCEKDWTLSKYIKEHCGYSVVGGSIIGDPLQEEFLFECMEGSKTVLEIGTYRGATACVVAYSGRLVFTVDIKNYLNRYTLWNHFGVINNIIPVMVIDDRDKAVELERLEYDFAIIDGDHSAKGVEIDFNLVKKCGKVFFHDYGLDGWGKEKPGVKEYVDTIKEGKFTIKHGCAYWEAV